MLRVENLSTYYGNIQALKGVSLKVEEGEIVSLISKWGKQQRCLLFPDC